MPLTCGFATNLFCEEPFTHHISELVIRLKMQIINYLVLHPNTPGLCGRT
jgi:hypothetical protein